jgi:hypothetical protein
LDGDSWFNFDGIGAELTVGSSETAEMSMGDGAAGLEADLASSSRRAVDGGRMASRTEAGAASPRVSRERRTTPARLGSGGGPRGGPFRGSNLQAKLLVVQSEDALRDRADKLATPATSSEVLARKEGSDEG